MLPLVSIVVTAFNTGMFLDDCVKSIVNQTYDKWEIVFVDDKSTDNTLEKMKEIVIRNNIINKVKLFQHKENYGYGAALYNSIRKASGKIIAIVDSDDALLTPKALEIMVYTHGKYPNASLVYSNFEEADELLKFRKKRACTTLKPGQTVLSTYIKGQQYYGSSVIVSHFKTFKKSFYNKTGGVNPNLKKAVDRDIVLKLEEVGDLIHISQYLYLHRIHNNSISRTFKNKPKAYVDKINKMKTEMYKEAKKRREIKENTQKAK